MVRNTERAYDLTKDDLLTEDHKIVIYVINSFSPWFFNSLLMSSLNYIGAGTDVGGFVFWQELEEWEKKDYEPFDGVQVSMIIGVIERIVITYREYYYYLCKRINRYVKHRPEEKAQLYEAAEKLRVEYGIEESFLE